MICSDCIITGEVKIYAGAVINPKVTITADEHSSSSIGTKSIIEETSRIHNSSVGNESLLEVGAIVTSSSIGNSTFIGPKVTITNSTIGNNCWICPSLTIVNATIPDNTSVCSSAEGWVCRPVDNSIMVPIVEAYREKLVSADSLQALSRNFTKHGYSPLDA